MFNAASIFKNIEATDKTSNSGTLLRLCFFRYWSLRNDGTCKVTLDRGVVWFLNLCASYKKHMSGVYFWTTHLMAHWNPHNESLKRVFFHRTFDDAASIMIPPCGTSVNAEWVWGRGQGYPKISWSLISAGFVGESDPQIPLLQKSGICGTTYPQIPRSLKSTGFVRQHYLKIPWSQKTRDLWEKMIRKSRGCHERGICGAKSSANPALH